MAKVNSLGLTLRPLRPTNLKPALQWYADLVLLLLQPSRSAHDECLGRWQSLGLHL